MNKQLKILWKKTIATIDIIGVTFGVSVPPTFSSAGYRTPNFSGVIPYTAEK